MNKFAVIISAFGCPEYVMECVNAVKAQIKYTGWEYDIRIGIDGCQETADVLKQNNIKFFYSENNVGAYVIRNSLIYLSPADVYGYFDADDVMEKNYIYKNIEVLESSNCEAVISAKVNCHKNLVAIGDGNAVIETGGAMSFTHKALESVGGYYNFRCAGDTDLMERLRMAGHNIVNIEEPLYRRRRHNKSLTKSGLTIYGGDYRKKVWAKMCAKRDQGKIKIQPTTIKFKGMA